MKRIVDIHSFAFFFIQLGAPYPVKIGLSIHLFLYSRNISQAYFFFFSLFTRETRKKRGFSVAFKARLRSCRHQKTIRTFSTQRLWDLHI